jgi:deoxyribonuclease-4
MRFGPSGNDAKFYEQGGNTTVEMPKWLSDLGLTALEINFGRGVKMGTDMARAIGEQARKYNIAVSAHAPYFINLCSSDKDRIKKSYEYIKQCLSVLREINASDGATRLVVHVGSQCKLDRITAIKNCKKNLLWVIEKLKNDGFEDFLLCIETMGRYKAIGTPEEIFDICKINSHIVPTIDFGHVNAWEQGSIQKDPNRMIEIMKMCPATHIHFSAIIYTKMGEHTHTTLDDKKWAFDFEPLARYFKENKINATVICESKEHMATDAVKLLDIYKALC